MTEHLPLSAALREHTSKAHATAESTGFITALMEGRACAGAYAALVVQHVAMYEALEQAIDAYAGHPLIAPFDDPALRRSSALVADLAGLFAHGTFGELPADRDLVVPATRAYVDVLTSDPSPELVLGNHYVRYLGDMSGGQVIMRLIQRHYGLPDDTVNFYRFPGIEKLKPYKDSYRAKLDALEVTPAQRSRILDEAARSFTLNRAVLDDLGASRFGSHEAAGVGA